MPAIEHYEWHHKAAAGGNATGEKDNFRTGEKTCPCGQLKGGRARLQVLQDQVVPSLDSELG